MRQIAAKFVSCLLNVDQKQNRLSVSKDLQDQAKNGRNLYDLPVQKKKIHLKGQLFKDIAEIQVDCSGAGRHHGMGVSATPPEVEEVLGHLYKLQRRQYCA